MTLLEHKRDATSASFGSRRAFFKSLSIVPFLFGAAVPFCATAGVMKRYPFDEFFEYEVKLEVDGVAYTFRNGARLIGHRTHSSDYWRYQWWCAPCATKLPSGETLLVAPPSPAIGMRDLLDRTEKRGHGNYAPNMMRKALSAQYPVGAVPLVFILDNPDQPQKIDGFMMRVALLGRRTRVHVLGLSVAHAKKDARQPVASMVPWLEPAEDFTKLRELGFDSMSAEFKRLEQKWGARQEPLSSGWSPEPRFYTAEARIKFNGAQNDAQKASHDAAVEAVTLPELKVALLLPNQDATLPLRFATADGQPALVAAESPFVHEFYSEPPSSGPHLDPLYGRFSSAKSADILGQRYLPQKNSVFWRAEKGPSLLLQQGTDNFNGMMLGLSSGSAAAPSDVPNRFFGILDTNGAGASCDLS